MDPLTAAAASGLRSRIQSLDILANNLANSATSGYKSDRESYRLFSSSEASDAGGVGMDSAMPMIGRLWTDFTQGNLQPTNNSFDVALSGRGFLTVEGPGGTLYTRSGSLRISNSGELVTGEGFPVRTVGGGSIHIASGKAVEISQDGEVRQDGRSLGQLEIVDFKHTDSLKKMSGGCFQNTDPKNLPAPADDVKVEQGKLEGSNVAVPDAAMRLVGVMRQFEMLQKAVSMGVDMNRRAIEEVARVT